MEEKNSITISITTVLLIVAIIIIAIMGCFIYKMSNEKTVIAQNAPGLQTQVSTLEKTTNNSNTEKASTSHETKTVSTDEITFNSLQGTYTAKAESVTGEMDNISISLNENGSFYYRNKSGFQSGYEGYYTLNENNVILHVVLECGNDIGATVTDKTISATLDGNSLTVKDEQNMTLEKTSDTPTHEFDSLATSIKARLAEDALN